MQETNHCTQQTVLRKILPTPIEYFEQAVLQSSLIHRKPFHLCSQDSLKVPSSSAPIILGDLFLPGIFWQPSAVKYQMCMCQSLSCVQFLMNLWIPALQAPQSMEFSRQEYWSGLPVPSPGDLPNPGMEPGSAELQVDSLSFEPPGEPNGSLQLQLSGASEVHRNQLGILFKHSFGFCWVRGGA